MTPVLNLQEIKSDFNSKILNFNMGYIQGHRNDKRARGQNGFQRPPLRIIVFWWDRERFSVFICISVRYVVVILYFINSHKTFLYDMIFFMFQPFHKV